MARRYDTQAKALELPKLEIAVAIQR